MMLCNVFFKEYFRELNKEGGVTLGFTVKSSKPFPNNVSLIPTDLNFEISAYKDNGEATQDYDAYTLNYLIMSDGHTMPASVPFNWNWVERDNLKREAGIMAVNRDTFMGFLSSKLSSSLARLAWKPKCSFSVNLIEAKVGTSFNRDISPQKFQTIGSGLILLTYSYISSDKSERWFGLNWGNWSVTYKASCYASVSGKVITIVAGVNARCHLNVDGGVTEGNWASYQITTTYTIGVTSDGTLVVTQNNPQVIDQSEKPDISVWSKIVSAGQIVGCINGIQRNLKSWLKNFGTGFADDIAKMLKGSQGWVFPGGKSYAFNDVQFSDNQDLVADLLYVTPKVSKAIRNHLVSISRPPENDVVAKKTSASPEAYCRMSPDTTTMTPKYTITASTELMDNYKQSEVISPQKKFRAVQTDRDLALLFSIGTDGIFYLIEQRTDHETGWERIDLSSELSSLHDNSPVVAKTFAVAQNTKTQKIDLVLVITVGCGDFLYISLGNDNTAGAIMANTIIWTRVPFDDPQHVGIALDVVDVYIVESRFEQYIVADISQSTFKTNPTNYLSRYYIDTFASQKWNPMTIGGELEPGASSCLGRIAGDRVDGMYTLGTISGISELLYAPLYNFFEQAPVTIRRLTMPQGATVIAASDAGNDETNLFVAASDGLYYFANDNQEDDATGVRVVSNDLFNGATALYAIASDNLVTVWGLNGRTSEIFYTSCPAEKQTMPNAWSVPLPIMTNVEHVAPYVNRRNSANTFFAHTGEGEMKIGVKSPQTTIWKRQSITLPLSDTKVKATKFRSYTTRIRVDENGHPVGDAEVYISSDSDTSVYINHLYHVIGTTPVQVKTDALGTITVIEAISTLAGARLHVSLADGTKISINPMNKPLERATDLQSASDLHNAIITYQNGDKKKLVKDGVDSKTLDAVAKANIQLAVAYQQVGSGRMGGGAARISAQALTKSVASSGFEEHLGRSG